MKIKIGKREILCDSAKETGGKLSLYQGGMEIMQIANIPDMSQIVAEDGEIEHAPTELEQAKEQIAELETKVEELTPADDDVTDEDILSALAEIGAYRGER